MGYHRQTEYHLDQPPPEPSRRTRIINRQPTPHPRKHTATYQMRRYSWLVAGLFGMALYGSYNDSRASLYGGMEQPTDEDHPNSAHVIQKPKNQNDNGDDKSSTPIASSTNTNRRMVTAVATENSKKEVKPIDEASLQAAAHSMQTNQINGFEFYWQLPEPRAQQNQPQGILFLAHPCHGSGKDWWPKASATGGGDDSSSSNNNDDSDKALIPPLPEQEAIVDMARKQLQMVVVSMSASEVKTKCWFGRDTPGVATVLKYLQTTLMQYNKDNNEESSPLPIYAMGFGSGGSFVSTTLPFDLQKQAIEKNEEPLALAGYVSQLSGPKRMSPKARGELKTFQSPPPPGVFISMPRDMVTRTEIQTHIVRNAAKPNEEQQLDGDEEILLKHIQLPYHRLDATFFNKRVPHVISDKLSRQLYNALVSHKGPALLDARGEHFQEDPRKSMRQWNAAVEPVLTAALKAEPDKFQHVDTGAGLSQLLNVVWGHTEVTRDGVLDAMQWLMSRHEKERKKQQQTEEQKHRRLGSTASHLRKRETPRLSSQILIQQATFP